MKKLLIFFAALSLSACAPQLVILHVNDTHSHHEPVRGGLRNGQGGIIERAAIVDSVRLAEGPQNVLLVHAGDFNQGTSYYSELGGSLEVDVVNAFAYDAITLGNHEFDNGIEHLASRLARINCPVVCANVEFSGTELEPFVKPWCVVEKAGKKIGIIGATSNLSTNVKHSISERLKQYDNAEVINKYARILRREQKCDLVIFLSHLGYHEDQEVVGKVRGVDLVIGGHSHTFVEDFVWVKDLDGKRVPVITDGCWGFEIGKIVVK